MQRLSSLDIGCPRIRSIPPIQNLKSLRITGCKKLETLPYSLFESEELEKLVISKCRRLVELPISLGVQNKLVSFELVDCKNLKKLPNSIQMESLERLHIYDCPKLDSFPEIKGDMDRLSTLTLQCTRTRELPLSIGNLSGLTTLDLDDCVNLASLPDSLCNLKNLQNLLIRGCKKLDKLPENMCDLQQLVELSARETGISLLPHSITKLGKLTTLDFSLKQVQHSSSSFLHQVSGLSSLKRLDLGNKNISGGLPEDLGSLHSLETLILRGNNISCFPKSINNLLHLKRLDVQFCGSLRELPEELPPNLEVLDADDHLALKSVRDVLIKCVKLREMSFVENTKCKLVSTSLLKFIGHLLRIIQNDFYERGYFSISFLKGRKFAQSFSHPFLMNLNPTWYTDKFLGFTICCHVIIDIAAHFFCKLSDSEGKHALNYYISPYRSLLDDCAPILSFICIPFKAFWRASGSKEAKNPNRYCLFEACTSENITILTIRLEYENKVIEIRRTPLHQNDGGLHLGYETTEIGCSMACEQLEHHMATEKGLPWGYENKALEAAQATMTDQNEHEFQKVPSDSPPRKMDDSSRNSKRKRKRNENKKGKTTSNYPTCMHDFGWITESLSL